MRKHLDKLRSDAEHFDQISMLATDSHKRASFAKLAAHLKILASEVERAIELQIAGGTK